MIFVIFHSTKRSRQLAIWPVHGHSSIGHAEITEFKLFIGNGVLWRRDEQRADALYSPEGAETRCRRGGDAVKSNILPLREIANDIRGQAASIHIVCFILTVGERVWAVREMRPHQTPIGRHRNVKQINYLPLR